MRILVFVVIAIAMLSSAAPAYAQRAAPPAPDVLEGTLRVHPKFHYRYYLDGIGDGQRCALFQADDRLQQIEPGACVRVSGKLASKFFGQANPAAPSALVVTWVVYMDVAKVEVLPPLATSRSDVSSGRHGTRSRIGSCVRATTAAV